MSTELQISANRRNSQKSTGPCTTAGKLTSSQNACNTGIYSAAEIIRGESREDLDALAASYYTRFQPDGPAESAQVDILVHCEWMLRRFRRAEAQLWERNANSSAGSFPDSFHLGRAVDYNSGHSFSRLQRRIDSTQRNFRHALQDLKHLQSDRPTQQPVPKIQPASEAAPIGFVPSNLPQAQPEPAALLPPHHPIGVHRCSSVAQIAGSAPRAAAPTPPPPSIGFIPSAVKQPPLQNSELPPSNLRIPC